MSRSADALADFSHSTRPRRICFPRVRESLVHLKRRRRYRFWGPSVGAAPSKLCWLRMDLVGETTPVRNEQRQESFAQKRSDFNRPIAMLLLRSSKKERRNMTQAGNIIRVAFVLQFRGCAIFWTGA